jgi:multidrug transporter EmrE-like cation transporter
VTLRLFLLILASVSLSAFAQIALKMGMSTPSVLAAMHSGPPLTWFVPVATNTRVLGGLTLYFLSAALWLLVLSRLPVSAAYPFVGLGFVLTMLFGWLALGEPLGASRIGGTALVAIGVVLIARG